MNKQELFNYLAEHLEFPTVRSNVPVKYAKKLEAKITRIEMYNGHLSVGIQFPGMFYHKWFRDSDSQDKRSNYFHQLEIIN